MLALTEEKEAESLLVEAWVSSISLLFFDVRKLTLRNHTRCFPSPLVGNHLGKLSSSLGHPDFEQSLSQSRAGLPKAKSPVAEELPFRMNRVKMPLMLCVFLGMVLGSGGCAIAPNKESIARKHVKELQSNDEEARRKAALELGNLGVSRNHLV